ncbi:MAG: branched-chain-amino-acid transaminase [Spirochaetales bacterium]|nr:branched-chain-amino-acid transaminase [Spirochaetales bacterium]
MPKGFTLEINPSVYLAKYQADNKWLEEFKDMPHLSREEEESLSKDERLELILKRNSFPELPLVNYTTQYGVGCFEGLKAFPQKDGSLKLFRPIENAMRMEKSMRGLMMPVFPKELFVNAVIKIVSKNKKMGFTPQFDPAWEKEDFIFGHSVYIRPFTYAESSIGLGISKYPWVVIVTTTVGAYFMADTPSAVTTDMIRATPHGTGSIKCNANYVIAILAKKNAEANGYMEAIFLDAYERNYVEEGSSCNIFFLLKDDTLVTPNLEDTILPGITRKSVLTIAEDLGLKTQERRISIDEAMSESKEVFVTGTAAGVSYIESITHQGKTAVFNNKKIGEISHTLLITLKGIQYGAKEDKYGWMIDVDK